MKNIFQFLLIITLFTTILFAQETNKKQKENNSKTTNGAIGIEAPQAVEGDVVFSDGSNNLLRITDEGTTGAIQFQDGVPSDVTNKLYNNSGTLHFNGTALGSGGANSLNELTDATAKNNGYYVGDGSGQSINNTGILNVGFGLFSMNKNTTGKTNTALGGSTLFENTTGQDNVAAGYASGYKNTEGESNVSIGRNSNYENQTGSFNTVIGSEAGKGMPSNSISGSVFLGYKAGFSETTSNKLYIENSDSDTPLIWGDFGVDSLRLNGDVHILGNLTFDGTLFKNSLDLIGSMSISNALSVGEDAESLAPNSVAFGKNTSVLGITSFAAGEDNAVFSYNSSTFGLGLRSSSYLSTVIGRFNDNDLLFDNENWVANEPLFIIGNGTDDANRSNALTILKNGNVSIGPMEGAGSKLLWNTTKSAFRAGSVQTQWDDANIGSYSTAFNYRTTASGTYSFATGYQTEASGQRATAMGSNSLASGLHSTAIGSSIEATGNYSTALGRYVNSEHIGSFIIGDNTSTIFQTIADNSFMARFAGGYTLYSSSNTGFGVVLPAGGSSWSAVSDSTKKENFLQVDGEEVLNKISKFNLRSWNYKGQDPTKFRHYGPMAQEFYAAFGNDGIGTVGNDSTIASADFDGINLIAIQALEKICTDLRSRINILEDQNQELVKINSEYRTQNKELRNVNLELANNIEKIKEAISTISSQNKNVNIALSQ